MKKTISSLKTALAVCVCVYATTASWAASGVWNGTVNSQWIYHNNWSAYPYPSVADTASFTNAGNGQTLIDIAGLTSIKTIIYDSPAVAAYTNGIGAPNSQTLVLADNGVITLTDTAANSQLFNCGLQLGAGMDGYTYTLTNANTSQTLTFNNVFGPAAGGTAGAKTLAINGPGNTTILGNITKGGASSLTLTDNSSGTVTVMGTNTLFAAVNMNGSGKIVLSGSNTVTTLNMNGGTNSIVDIGDGVLALSNNGSTTLASTQGGFINGTGKLWLSGSSGTFADNNVAFGKTLTINTTIVSPGGFEFWGPTPPYGTFVLNATNTFDLDVTINQSGSISVWKIGNKGSTDSNLGKGTQFIFNAPTAPGARLLYTGTGEESDRILSLSTNATLEHAGTGILKFTSPLISSSATTTKLLTLQGSTAGIGEIAGVIPVGSGTTTALTKTGTGTWILSALNTYAGATTINGGTLILTGTNGSINASTGYTINAGGTLLLENTLTANNTNRLRDASTITLNGGTLCMTNNGGAMNYRENAGTLALAPGGNSTIATTEAAIDQTNILTFASLTYSGGKINFIGTGLGDSDQNRIFFLAGVTNGLMGSWATVNGTSYAAYSSTLGVYAFTNGVNDIAAEGGVAESVIPDNGALLARINLPGVSGPITLQGEWTNSIGQVLQNTTTNTTIAMFDGVTNKLLQAAGLSIAEGKAKLTVGENENHGYLTPLTSGGTLVLENNSSSSELIVNAAILNNTVASKLSKIGAGIVVLNGTNTYSGTTTINEGILAIGGTLTQTVTGVISGAGALTKTGSSTLNLNAANTFTGGLTINEGTVATANAGGLGNGAVTNNSTLNLTGGGLTYTGLSTSLAGSGTNNVTLGTGSATTFLNGDYSAFTGVWNVGVGAVDSAGKVQMNGLDNSAATINILSNATIYCVGPTNHIAKIILNGGNTGESYGQLRLDNVSWAGPVTLAGPITDGNDAFFGNDSPALISGVIDDLGNGFTVDKLRGGILTFSGANTYRGPTWIKAGAISVPSINNINSGAGTLGSPLNAAQGAIKLGYTTTATTLFYTGAGNTSDRLIDLAGTTGGATLDQSGTNALVFTGGMTVSGTGNKTLTLQGSTIGTGEFSGIISNSVDSMISVTKAGTGLWALSGVNTYTGLTTVTAGTLSLRGANVLSPFSAVSLNAATLQVLQDGSGNNETINFGNSVTLNNSVTTTIDVGNNGSGNTGNTIAFGALNNGPVGTAFGSAINFTGTNGYLQSFTSLALPGASGNSTYLRPTTTSVTILGNVFGQQTAPASGQFDTLNLEGTSANNRILGVISDCPGYVNVNQGDTRITKNNTSTWTLSGTNTYRGVTTVNGGTLLINGSISNNSAVTVASGATLGGFGAIKAPVTLSAGGILAPGDFNAVGTLGITNTLALNGNLLRYDVSNVATDKVAVASALTLNGINAVVLSFPDGAIQAGNYTLMTFPSRSGTGSFVLFPAYANCSLVTTATNVVLLVSDTAGFSDVTWTGTQSANWNIVDQNWTNSSGASAYADGNGVTFDDTASGNFTLTSDMVGIAPAAIAFNNTFNNYSITAAITSAAPIVKLGSGTATLSGVSAYNPLSINIGAGTLTFSGASQLNNGLHTTDIINNGTFNYASSGTQTLSGVISGTGALSLFGNGMLTLTGANTYAGATTVNAGVLKIQNNSGLGTVAVGTTVNAGATLELAGNIITPAEVLTLGGTLSSQTGYNTYAGNIYFQSGAFINVGSGSTNIISGTTQANTYGFNKVGAGTLRIATDPAQTGPFVVTEGTLELLHGGGTDAAFIIGPGATLRQLGNANVIWDAGAFTNNGTYDMRVAETISTLIGNGLVTVGSSVSIAFGIGNDSKAGTFSGVIENGLGLMNVTKYGAGTQILSGTNTYTGTTTVSSGILLVNAPGSLAVGSAVTVANGAILGGNGVVNGLVTLSTGGNLAPGGVNSMGTLTLGSSLILNGNTLFFDISNLAQDRVNIASFLTRNGVNTIIVNGIVPAGDYTLMTFLSHTGTIPFTLVGISNASLELTETSLILHVASSSGGASLTWAGDKSSLWDGGIQNWLNNGTPSIFASGDAVLFDDAALNYTVNSGSAVAPSAVLFNNSVNVYTINAIIGGTASVSKFGIVNANLVGVNTYSGPTVVNQGTLAINSPGQLGSGNYAQNIIINGGATFHYASTANQVLSGVMSGSGTFTKSGTSTLTLTNANTRTGGTTLSGGTLIAKEFPTALGTGALALNTAAAILELDSDTGVAFNNNAVVSAAMTVKSGRLTSGLGVTNTLGTLSINATTLTASQGASVASGTAGLTFGATTLTGAPTFDVSTGTLLTLGALGGSYNFTKSGVGTLNFGTAGSRTAGNSTLTAGTLKLGSAAGLGTTGTTNVLNGGTLDLAIDTTVNSYITFVGGNTTIQSDRATVNSDGITHTLGTLSIGTFTLSVTNGPNVRVQSPFGLTFGATTMTGNPIIDVANNGTGLGTLTLGAVSGNFTLTKKNFGTLKFAGINVYNGATTINNGRVMGVSNASCSNSAFTVQSTVLANANAGLSILCNVANGQWVCTNLTTSAASAPATALPVLDFLFTVPPSTNVAPFRVLKDVVFGTNPVVNVYLGNLTITATNYPLMVVGGTAPTNIIPPLNISGGYTNSFLFWTNNTLTLKLVGTSLPMKWTPGVTSSGIWDINNSANLVWTNGIAAIYYQESAGTGVTGDRVLFDDAYLAGNSTVTLSTYVSPSVMTVSNSLYSYTFEGSGGIAGTNSLTKQGTNALTLGTANTYSGVTTLSAGILTIPTGGAINSGNLAGLGQLVIGNMATNAILNISGGTVNLRNVDLSVGTVSKAIGVINLSSGTLYASVQSFFGAGGNGVTGFGALNVSGGSAIFAEYLALGRSPANTGLNRGELLVSGGTVTVTLNNLEIGSYQNAVASTCVATLTGGITTMAVLAGDVMVGKASHGILTVDGSAELNILNLSKSLRFGTTANVIGIANLKGGVITTPAITQVGGCFGYFNFDGGLLKANKANTAFMTGLTAARVFEGGAIIDDGGFAITIAQPLVTPATGNGVSIGTLAVSGSGFIAPPIVDIAGSGTGASAITTIDANGNLLGVTLTCPGVGYIGTPTFTFTGGGGTVIQTGYATTAPNTSGGLTKLGSGTLTLSAVNTYSGDTIINNGKLLVMPAVSCANSTVTVQPSGIGATATFAVRNNGSNEQWTCNGLITSAGANGATANPVVEFNFSATPSATTAPLVVTGTATFSVTPDFNVFLVNLNVPAGSYPLMVVGGTAPVTVPTLTVMGGYSGSTLSWSGNTLMLNIAGTSAPITWSTGITGSGTWNINNSANQVWKTAGAVPTYYQEIMGMPGDQVLFADTYITANTAVTLNTIVTPASVLANNSTYAYTLSGSAIAGTTRLTKSGGAALTLSSANTYSGGTTIAGGGILTLGNAGSLGSGAVTNDGILNILGGNNVTITGLSTALSGAGTNNVTLGTGTQSTYLDGNYSGFTGVWNIGIGALSVAGRATMNGNVQGVDNSLATINILTNATLWINLAGTHNATAVLNGGDTGEPYGQLRLDYCDWAGSVILAGLLTDVNDAFLGSEGANSRISGIISELGGPYEVTKLGSKILTLTGNNTFRGPVWVKAGSISVPVIKNVDDGAGPLGAPTTTEQARVKLGYTTTAGALVYIGMGETTTRIIDMAGTTGGATLDQSGTNALVFTGGMTISGTGNKTLTLQGSTIGTGEFAGVISNGVASTISVIKTNSGTWILSGANTYSGVTIVSGGTLDLNGSLANGGVLVNGGTGSRVIVRSATALGTGSISLASGSTTPFLDLKIDGGGEISLPNPFVGNSSIIHTINVDNNGTGTGGVIQFNAPTNRFANATLNVTGTNGYSLYFSNLRNAAGSGGTMTLNPTTAALGIGALSGHYTAANNYIVVLDGTHPSNTITGMISDKTDTAATTIAITKQNTSTWTLSGTNTYSGATTIAGGKLVLTGADGSLLGTSSITLSGNGTLELQGASLASNTNRLRDGAGITLNGGVLNFSHTGGDADYSEMAGALTLNNSANTVSSSQADNGRTSVVSFASLTRTGSGTINFTGNGLGLNEQNKILFTNMANTAFIGLWATYNTTNLAAYDVNMGIIPAGESAFTNLTAKGPSIIPNDQTLNARINEEGTEGGISLAGVTTNKIKSLLQNTTFDAVVAMTNKMLQVSDVMIAMGMGSLTLGSTPNEGFLSPLVASGQLQLINQSANALTINAAITNNTGTSSVNKIGTGTVVLTGTNTYTGTTTIQEGVLEFSGDSIQTRGGVISGNGSLAKSGSGTLSLTVANTYTGPTTISGGLLKAGNAAALGTAVGGTFITSGGTLDLNGFNLGDEVVTIAGSGVNSAGAIISTGAADQQNAFRFVTLTDDAAFGGTRRWDIRYTSSATLDMGGHTLAKTGVNTVCLVSVNVINPGAINVQQGQLGIQVNTTLGGGLTNIATVQSGAILDLYGLPTPIAWTLALSNNATLSVSSGTGTQNTWSGPVMLNGTGVVSAAASTAQTISGPITGTGPLQKIGAGTVTLSGATTYDGGTVVTAGLLLLTGNHTYTGGTFINAGTTLQLGDGTTTSGTISGDVTNAAAMVFNNPTATTNASVIRGTGMVIKQALGVLTLSGASSYSGATIVSNGTLLVNSPGSLSNTAVTVNNTCTLGGSGTIYGTVNMAAGSILVPGDTNVIETLTFAKNSATSLTLNGNTLRFEISNVEGIYDRIAITGVSGNLVLNGVNIVDLNFTAGSIPEGVYTLMTFASRTGNGAFALATGYPNATLTTDNTSLILTVGTGGTTYGLTWKGSASSIWDSVVEQNWLTQGTATNFAAGDGVTFNDTASRFTVSSGNPIAPSSVLFNNSANVYTVLAAIDGTGPLVKNGSNTATLSGLSTYNPSSLAINAGTLVLAGASQLNSGLYATNIFTVGTFNYGSSATQTLSGSVYGPGTLIKSGTGSLTLSGTNTIGAVTMSSGSLIFDSTNTVTGNFNVNGGSAGSLVTLNGSMTIPGAASYLNLAAAANDRSVLNHNGALTIGYNFNIGNANASVGACYQTNGFTSVTNYLGVGAVAGGYGYYRLSGGTLYIKNYLEIATYGSGVFDMFDGLISTDTNFDLARRFGVVGVLNVFAGTAKAPSGPNPIQMGRNDYAGPVARLTIMGSGVVDAANGSSTAKILDMNAGNGNGGNTAVNLLTGGTLIANKVSATRLGSMVFNFDGGTLKAAPLTTVGATFLTGLDSAIVYPGGAIIDSTNVNITVAQPLLAPTDYGVVSVDLTSGGAGYIGAPVVTITGGSGTNATAIAKVDVNPASEFFGQITSIQVTSPGVRYQSGDVLTVMFSGGGYTSLASATATVGVNSQSGGLTKLGSSTLTLSGTNTYGGATTIIGNGTIRLGVANALPTNNVVNVGSGTFDLGGFTVTNGAVNVTSGSIINGRLLASSITVEDSAVIRSALSGLNGLTKNGNGKLTLNWCGGNFITGPLVLNGGTVRLEPGPLDAGLSYWLDATDSSKLSLTDTNVTAWADSAADGVNFTQGNAVNQPVYIANALNGRPAVRFNGNTNKLVASKAVNAQTVFIVNNVRGRCPDNQGNEGIWGQNGADLGIRLSSLTAWIYPTANVNDFSYGGQMYINGLAGNTFTASTPHLLTAVSPTLRTGWTTSIGQYYATSRWFNGDIGEVLVYNSILSTNDRKAVEGYLMAKWLGTTNTNLPAGGSVSLASGTLLDLGGQPLSFTDLSGSGTVSNGALTVTETISPAGTNAIGTLTVKGNATLSGKLIVDADANTSDLLDVQGDLTLFSPTLEIANLQGLSTIKVYTLITSTVPITGALTLPENLSSTRWTLRKTPDGTKIQLYYKGGTMIRIM